MFRSWSRYELLQDEAFELWTEEWGRIYEEGSSSKKLLKEIADTWFLVSLVDNNFVNGDLFSVFNIRSKANGTAQGTANGKA